MRKIFCTLTVMALCLFGQAKAAETIQLPAPTLSGGISLTLALQQRQSQRNFADVDVSPQEMADLLWSTAGINRQDGKKVYAVAQNRHDMTVYVFTRQGVYRYDPQANTLTLLTAGDHRARTGEQPYVAGAAINLVFVQDMGMWPGQTEAGKELGFAHTGEMVQNAYLYAAGQGWAAVVRGLVDRQALKQFLQLPPQHFVRLAQSIGPKP